MDSLTQMLETIVTLDKSKHIVCICNIYHMEFRQVEQAELTRSGIIRDLAKAIHRWLCEQAVGNPPASLEALAQTVKWDIGETAKHVVVPEESFDALMAVARWQQAVIVWLANENGYEEGKKEGREEIKRQMAENSLGSDILGEWNIIEDY